MTHDIDRNNESEVVDEWVHGIVHVDPGSNARKLLVALASVLDELDASFENVTDAHHLDNATDEEIERLSLPVDVDRKTGESDGKYRERIRAKARASTSGGTFEDILEFATAIFDTSETNVRLDTNYSTDPATVTISLPQSSINDSPLTAAEIKDIFDDVVSAGHSTKVNKRGTFELKSAGDPDDPDRGLTSDSISTGGTLAADL